MTQLSKQAQRSLLDPNFEATNPPPQRPAHVLRPRALGKLRQAGDGRRRHGGSSGQDDGKETRQYGRYQGSERKGEEKEEGGHPGMVTTGTDIGRAQTFFYLDPKTQTFN